MHVKKIKHNKLWPHNKKSKVDKEIKFKPDHKKNFLVKFLNFIKWKIWDIRNVSRSEFSEYGLTIYTGMQGYGKTISLVERLEEIHNKYPDVPIYTNFGYVNETGQLLDWNQLLEIRSDNGVVFAIDEIQNEFDIYDARNFDMSILRTITQQRKQGIKIFGTSQVFTRVSKPLREQTFEVVECFTVLGRWTFQKCFSADWYNLVMDNPDRKSKLSRKWRKNFIQTNKIRSLYDSYRVIDEMSKLQKKALESKIKGK